MRELIYKDEAYRAIDNCIRDSWYRISPADAKMNIHHLVSDASEADRPQGEWIDIEPRLNRRRVNKYKRCSHCGFSWARPFDDNYCPNCGARMKGADDDY